MPPNPPGQPRRTPRALAIGLGVAAVVLAVLSFLAVCTPAFR